MIPVLIVDGLTDVRRGLRCVIEPDMTVVGETGKVGEAVDPRPGLLTLM